MKKILYAIQGTGNGHLSRAMDVIPCLMKNAQVDILVSGIQGDLELPFNLKYKLRGLSFIFGKSGGVNLWKTVLKADLRKLAKSIDLLPVEEYDLVINDFEPVSAWACYLKNKPCIALSHQAAVMHPLAPQAEHSDMIGKLVLNNYAPATSAYGFHFENYADNIFHPVIRKQVREKQLLDHGHISVYLPSYDDKRLVENLSAFNNVRWEVFSKHNKKSKEYKNVRINPVNNDAFIDSMASSSGVLCGAGFETPAEALFMQKKLLVIPMKSQYEQHLNAAALKKMGVPVMKSLKPRHAHVIAEWLRNGQAVKVNYQDNTQQIVDTIVKRHMSGESADWNINAYTPSIL